MGLLMALLVHGAIRPQEERRSSVRKMLPNWSFAVERVTGIEPALSAWESVRFMLLCGLTCRVGYPRVTVRGPSLPGLMAR
jgi:hypothetical protein